MENVKNVIIDLENLIPEFDQAINEVEKKGKLKELGHKLSHLYNKKKTIKYDTIEDLFKNAIIEQEMMAVLDDIVKIFDFDIFNCDLLLSETSVKRLNDKILLFVKYIKLITFPSQDIPTIEKRQIPEILSLYAKYKADDLFIQLLEPFLNEELNDNMYMIMEMIKNNTYPIDDEIKGKSTLSKNIYANLLQRYSIGHDSGYIPFSQLIKEILNISNATIDKIGSIAKSKNVAIITIVRDTNILYNTWKLFEKKLPRVEGISESLIDQLNTIKRVDYSVTPAITLYYKGNIHNVLKMRKFNAQLNNELMDLPYFVFESVDNINWRQLYVDKRHIMHILAGPNKIVAANNMQIEKGILEHWKGAKNIIWTSTHKHIAIIRQSINHNILSYWKSKKISNITAIDEFINDDELMNKFNAELFDAFHLYAQKLHVKQIIEQESMTSFLSDVTIRSKRFRRELNNIYNKERKNLLPLAESKNKMDVSAVYNMVEKILTDALESTISEKDNIFNTLDEKRILFN